MSQLVSQLRCIQNLIPSSHILRGLPSAHFSSNFAKVKQQTIPEGKYSLVLTFSDAISHQKNGFARLLQSACRNLCNVILTT